MLCYLFSFYLHAWNSPTQRIASHHLLYCICENLPQVFAVAICRENLPRIFCIYKRILFCICEQVLFIWRQIFLICVQNFLICEIFFINTASSCYIVAIMGHRRTPMLWANLPEKYKTATSLDSFKTKMKIWKCETCFGRLCRTYQQNLGFYKKYFFQ